jgi:hypothetical protein
MSYTTLTPLQIAEWPVPIAVNGPFLPTPVMVGDGLTQWFGEIPGEMKTSARQCVHGSPARGHGCFPRR